MTPKPPYVSKRVKEIDLPNNMFPKTNGKCVWCGNDIDESFLGKTCSEHCKRTLETLGYEEV